MAADLQSVAQLLQASLDAKQAKQGTYRTPIFSFCSCRLSSNLEQQLRLTPGVAQEALENQQRSKGFSLALLQITASENYPLNTRLAGALYFKNFIKRNWADEDGHYKLPENEVNTIKQQIISLMTSVPGAIKVQIGEAISIIAESDFYDRWVTLVDVSNPTFPSGRLLIRRYRILSHAFRPMTLWPIMASCKLPTRSSSDGDHYSVRTSSSQRSTMC
jgi:exportin-2 (importin alpha re-exporter)